MRMSDWSSDVCSFDLGRAQDVGDEDDAHSQGRAGGKRDGGGDAAFTETPAEKESRNIWWWQEEAISAWFEAGGREDDFWATTPLNVQRFLIGYNKRKDAAHNDIRWLAWHKIGRASCRQRVCQQVQISVVADSFKKKKKKTEKLQNTK